MIRPRSLLAFELGWRLWIGVYGAVTTSYTRKPHNRRRQRKATATVAASIATLIGVASPAAADPWGTGGTHTGWKPDANPHTYCFRIGQLGATDRNRVHDTYDITDQNSDMNALHLTTCTVDTDVWWGEVNLGLYRGEYECITRNGSTCASADVRMDTTELQDSGDMGGTYDSNFRKTACHENGHSMGLTHYKTEPFMDPPLGQQDCMISGPVNNDAIWRVYAAHHKDHINNDAF